MVFLHHIKDLRKKYSDLVGLLTVVITMIAATWKIGSDVNDKFLVINERMGRIERDIAVVKAILVVKHIIPSDLTATSPKGGTNGMDQYRRFSTASSRGLLFSE